jgi:hypothetical protein
MLIPTTAALRSKQICKIAPRFWMGAATAFPTGVGAAIDLRGAKIAREERRRLVNRMV